MPPRSLIFPALTLPNLNIPFHRAVVDPLPLAIALGPGVELEESIGDERGDDVFGAVRFGLTDRAGRGAGEAIEEDMSDVE